MRHTRLTYFGLSLMVAATATACIDSDRPGSPVWDGTAIDADETSRFEDSNTELVLDLIPADLPETIDLGSELLDSAEELKADSEITDLADEQDICTPECGDWECGDDGCGGECGDCDDDLFCTGDTCIQGECINAIIDGYCVIDEGCLEAGDLVEGNECLECRPSHEKLDWSFADDGTVCEEVLECFQGSCCDASLACDGAECGDDGCGGSCGSCEDPLAICFAGTCLCVPDCEGKTCGEGGCGTLCGVCTNPLEECIANQCVCTPDCDGATCGPNGCGGTCGSCEDDIECTSDVCLEGVCVNSVQDFFCYFAEQCVAVDTTAPENACQKCLPAQSQEDWTLLPPGALCGDESVCFVGECCPRGVNCQDKQCGSDGCGGDCGACPGPLDGCIEGKCVCQPACDGKNCGDDGCGSLCGACEDGELCDDGTCKCQPNSSSGCCGNDVCWFDSCGNLGDVQATCTFGCVDATCANCTPACDGLECGEDGCGGSCGTCSGFQQKCVEQLCVCIPDCADKECGGDGCGGSCGSCPGPQDSCLAGACICKAACAGIECGTDGCDGLCGNCPGPQDLCLEGICICQPDCSDKACGPDGCGDVCGNCEIALECVAAGCAQGACTFAQSPGTCLIDGECYEDGQTNPFNPCQICNPAEVQDQWSIRPDGITCGEGSICHLGLCCPAASNCLGKECGPNGCGGNCGGCIGPQDVCANGNCLCVAACEEKECGADGCDGICGVCSGGKVCQGSSCVCVSEHHTDCCDGNVCWVDSCGVLGEQALTCQYGCANGECNNCTPDCDGKECGGDGCGGSCGACLGPQELCIGGTCECQPACSGKVCGPDGCNGTCGLCPGDQDVCINGACICQPACADIVCGADGCGGNCGTCAGEQELCIDGACICQPDCAGKECGTDGCGGTCGSCNDSLDCTSDICSAGLCKNIRDTVYCIIDGSCYLVGQLDPVAPCNYCEPKGSPHEWATLPDGKACGGGDICYQEVCCPRTSNCAGLECGDDGCGGNCGSCGAGFFCIDQLCIDPTVCDDGNSVDWDGCTGGQVTEFRTNTYTSSNQQDPSVAVLKSGGYVIVWESDGPDEKWGVYGQRYGADGAKLGSQFRANKVDLGKENLDPDVAATVGGGFVIVWYAQEDINEFGNVIVSRRFGDDGIAIGSDITLPQYKSGSQERPAVTGLQDGGFAAVWDNDGSQDSQGIYLRLFDADGEAQGDQIPVNTVTSNNQLSADLVQLDSGSVVVVWVSKDQDGNGHGIFGRRFNSKGVGQESEVQLNSYFAGDQLGPRIAALDSGDFVVTWYQEGPDDNSGIMARRFSKAVIPVSDQFTVNSTLPEKQEFPCVGTLPGDAFIAAWQSQNQDGDGSGVYFRRHDSGNTPLGNDARANIYTTQAQTYPDCAGFGSGNFIIVWQSKNQDGNGEGIFHQRFHAEGYRLYP